MLWMADKRRPHGPNEAGQEIAGSACNEITYAGKSNHDDNILGDLSPNTRSHFSRRGKTREFRPRRPAAPVTRHWLRPLPASVASWRVEPHECVY